MQKATISIVVAMSKKRRAIGNKGRLLWHIPEDMRRFKALTTGRPIIMGRKTFESIVAYIGTPLPDRMNIVITRNKDFSYPGVMSAPTVEDALENARVFEQNEICIGGGAEIYTQALPFVDRLYLTLVDDEPAADAYFPEYEKEFTKIIASESRKTTEGLAYEFLTLERP